MDAQISGNIREADREEHTGRNRDRWKEGENERNSGTAQHKVNEASGNESGGIEKAKNCPGRRKCTEENNSTLLVRRVPRLSGPAEVRTQAAWPQKRCS